MKRPLRAPLGSLWQIILEPDCWHNIQNAQFRSKFQDDIAGMEGSRGIGVISDTDAQPLTVGSHLAPMPGDRRKESEGYPRRESSSPAV
jgi:hypothetical protein